MDLTDFFLWQTSYSPSGYLLACSGGRDSIALLAILGVRKAELTAPLKVVYVNHGWHQDAELWGDLVAKTTQYYGFDYTLVKLDSLSKRNAEAVAREARYQALADLLPAYGVLLTAHHQEDQAETLLLNLLRGSGLDGLSAMPERRAFSGGEHWRPLLYTERVEIERYVVKHGLRYVDDSSNVDTRYTRNWLRHEVLATMQTRFPDVAKRIASSAKQLGLARQYRDMTLDVQLPPDLGDKLVLDDLLPLPLYQQSLLIRRWLQRLNVPTPPREQLTEWLRQINGGAEHAQIIFSDWGLFNDSSGLYCLPAKAPELPPNFAMNTVWQGVGELQVSDEQGRLTGKNCRWALYPPGVRFRPQGKAHHKMLKEWFRLAKIPPFLRRRTPLLWSDEELVWVGDIGTAQSYEGVSVLWHKSRGSGRMGD